VLVDCVALATCLRKRAAVHVQLVELTGDMDRGSRYKPNPVPKSTSIQSITVEGVTLPVCHDFSTVHPQRELSLVCSGPPVSEKNRKAITSSPSECTDGMFPPVASAGDRGPRSTVQEAAG
jgi:hypothetical protein